MAAGKWDSLVSANLASLAMSFDAKARPHNPHDVVYRNPTADELAAESRATWAMIDAFFMSKARRRS
jgi:hypothetical protein